jgi:hypothetical protein
MLSKPPPTGEFRYAVSIDDGTNLWLTLWVRRSRSRECFVMYPRGWGSGDPHASYHRDGRFHSKSYNRKFMPQQRKPLDQFHGSEHLGQFQGHGTGLVKCVPKAFTSILSVPPGILEARRGSVLVDLVEPGHLPAAHHRQLPGLKIILEQTFKDCSPWVVIAVAAHNVP